MAQATSISWTDLTWGPVHGCSRVSAGCQRCYAETLSLRYKHTTKPWTANNAAENVLLKPHKLREPLSNAKAWRGLGDAARAAGKTDGMLVFVNSMSDLFHEQIPPDYIADVFAVMALATRHDFQVLTKRPERMRALLSADMFRGMVEASYEERGGRGELPWPLPNVWAGVSIENRKWVGRADVLRQTPAAVKFISAEPLLGPLTENMTHGRHCRCSACARQDWADPQLAPCGMHGRSCPPVYAPYGTLGRSPFGDGLRGIDWLIAGGESGPNFRPMDLQWMRDLCDACAASGTAFFAKQIAASRPGVDPPADLLIREFPAVQP